MADLEISQIFAEAREKYKSACQLADEESKNDPENDPYKSKYKAREILNELKADFEKTKEREASNVKLTIMTAGIDLKLGINYHDTEEIASGQSHLEFCISALQDLKLNPLACNILQHANNHLGILWTGRRKPKEALGYLQRADSLYKDFRHDVGNAPYTLDELFDPKEDEDPGTADQRRSSQFEDTYTHTLYYLAQVYTQLNEPKKAAEYCHVTLKRQLDTMKYQPIDWCLNAATLSQYYVTTQQFKMARHCLASATVILKELGEPITKCEVDDEDSQAEVDRKEKLPQTWSNLYRCWAKYGLALIEESKERIMKCGGVPEDDEQEVESSMKDLKVGEDHNADKKPGAEPSEEQEPTPGTSSQMNNDVYFNLEVTSSEEQIAYKWLRNFEEARPVFLCVQHWLNLAKEFYVLDGHCTDHIELIQDHSQAFKLLAFFEPDLERQCKMNKKRIDMLESILKQLSTQFYMMICRQLMFEIAETYSQMLDLKLAIIEEAGNPPTPHAIKKINTLCEQSIAHFQTYVNTLKTPQKVLPDKFAEDDERPALVAHFYMGRLFSKYIQYEVAGHLDNLKNSLDNYTYLVEYCRRNESARACIPSEYDVCSEMIVLLPHKMDKIRQRGAVI